MRKFIQEFKAFAVKGNVVDLAVAVIIGGAFGKIVSSLVADVIMPPLGLLSGGMDLADRQWTLKAAGEQTSAVTMNVGAFLQNVLDFLLIALVIFFMVKVIAILKEQAARLDPPEPPASPALSKPSREEELLTEIRDLLKKAGPKDD